MELKREASWMHRALQKVVNFNTSFTATTVVIFIFLDETTSFLEQSHFIRWSYKQLQILARLRSSNYKRFQND